MLRFLFSLSAVPIHILCQRRVFGPGNGLTSTPQRQTKANKSWPEDDKPAWILLAQATVVLISPSYPGRENSRKPLNEAICELFVKVARSDNDQLVGIDVLAECIRDSDRGEREDGFFLLRGKCEGTPCVEIRDNLSGDQRVTGSTHF